MISIRVDVDLVDFGWFCTVRVIPWMYTEQLHNLKLNVHLQSLCEMLEYLVLNSFGGNISDSHYIIFKISNTYFRSLVLN